MSLFLAGAASTGKTSLARLLSRNGFWYVEVEAERCWPIRDAGLRQACFLEEFSRRINKALKLVFSGRRVVADNSLLSVYAYTKALESLCGPDPMLRGVASAALDAWREGELALHHSGYARVAVVVCKPGEMRRRIVERLRAEGRRAANKHVELELELHMKAQNIMVGVAREYGVEIVENNDGALQATAERLARLALSARRLLPVRP